MDYVKTWVEATRRWDQETKSYLWKVAKERGLPEWWEFETTDHRDLVEWLATKDAQEAHPDF